MAEGTALDDDTFDDQSNWTVHTNRRSVASKSTHTDEGTMFKHNVLLKIGIPKGEHGRFNVHQPVYATFDMLFKTCPDAIITSDDSKHEINKIADFPKTSEAFTEFFKHEVAWSNNPRNNYSGNCLMKFQISSTKTIESIKSGEFLHFLRESSIHLNRHNFTSVRSAKMALLTMRHPIITNIPKLQARLRDRLYSALTSDIDLPTGLTAKIGCEIYLKTERIVHRLPSGDPAVTPTVISTEAIVIYTNAEHATNLAKLIAQENIFPEALFGHFVPWSVRHEKQVFADRLREHNAFTKRIQTFKLAGVSREMMDSPAQYMGCQGRSATVIAEARSSTHLDGVELAPIQQKKMLPRLCFQPEETNFTDTEGRWLIPYLQEQQKDAKVMIEHMIQHWKSFFPPTSSGNPGPRLLTRGDHPAQAYIASVRDRSLPTYVVEQPHQYNRFAHSRRQRPPIVIDVEDTTSWASVVRPKTPPANGNSQGTRKGAHHSTNHNSSVASADTTIVTNRTDLDSVVTQLRLESQKHIQTLKEDHIRSLQSLKDESDKRFANMQDALKQFSVELKVVRDMDEARSNRYEQMHKSLSDSITQLAMQMSTFMSTFRNNILTASPLTQASVQLPESLTDEELMAIDEPVTLSGQKRDMSARTPEKAANRVRSPPSVDHSRRETSSLATQLFNEVRTDPVSPGRGTEES